jgi:hypothetical protein
MAESIGLAEVEDAYLPLSRLLNLQVMAEHELAYATSVLLGEPSAQLPLVIGTAGSVAVGKSTTPRAPRELLARCRVIRASSWRRPTGSCCPTPSSSAAASAGSASSSSSPGSRGAISEAPRESLGEEPRVAPRTVT